MREHKLKLVSYCTIALPFLALIGYGLTRGGLALSKRIFSIPPNQEQARRTSLLGQQTLIPPKDPAPPTTHTPPPTNLPIDLPPKPPENQEPTAASHHLPPAEEDPIPPLPPPVLVKAPTKAPAKVRPFKTLLSHRPPTSEEFFALSPERMVKEIQHSKEGIKPLELMNAQGQNLFMYATTTDELFLSTDSRILNRPALLQELIRNFPDEAFSIKEEILEALTKRTNAKSAISWFLDFVLEGITHEINASLDPADIERLRTAQNEYQLLLHVAKQGKLPPNALDSLDAKIKTRVYEIAYACTNPFIHQPAAVPIRADQYSVNFMWINKHKIPDTDTTLFGDEHDFKTRFLDPIAQWIHANPGTRINIWYDSDLVDAKVIERVSQALTTEVKICEGSMDHVCFRSIRELDIVTANSHAFTPDIPVYYRADLLRAIVTDQLLQDPQNHEQYAVYADLDVKPILSAHLFDAKTVSLLDEFGFVLTKGGHLDFENSFHILNKNCEDLMHSHRTVMIDESLSRLTDRRNWAADQGIPIFGEKRSQEEMNGPMDEQEVFHTYPAMLALLLQTREDPDDETLDDVRAFRFDIFGKTAHSVITLKERELKTKEVMPRKPIDVPPSHFG